MNEYDKAARYQLKQDPAGFFRWLWRNADTPLRFHSWLDARRLALPVEGDLACDVVAAFNLPDQPEPTHALIVELKSLSERRALAQVQGYVYRLSTEPPATAVGILPPQVGGVVLHLSGPPQPRQVGATFPGLPECDWQFGVLQRTLREEEAPTTLAAILGGQTTRWLLLWLPLMHGGEEAAIMEGWKQAVLAENDEEVRATLVVFTQLFAELAKRTEAWNQALEGWNMQRSPFVEEWRNETRREALLTFLEERFGALPEEVVQRVRAVSDETRLKAALRQVVHIQSLDELQL